MERSFGLWIAFFEVLDPAIPTAQLHGDGVQLAEHGRRSHQLGFGEAGMVFGACRFQLLAHVVVDISSSYTMEVSKLLGGPVP
ncbi:MULTISPECIES: hypothetical protein [unclassified Streptomyces]|uniref:hypothetical protein n=1 Tax=unclassified Streptomyces TaxID=2593676 RepID=UPI00382CCB03